MSTGTVPSLPTLTAADLLTRGLFHDRIIPPLSSMGLLPAIPELLAYADLDKANSNGYRYAPQRSRCVRHSVPKRKLARRVLSIPNPRNQALLASEIAQNWAALQTICQLSPISLTTPVNSIKRALQGKIDRRTEAVERAKRSVGSRYVLHADIARFYPSIYTHSIPWAIHEKSVARAGGYALYGNRIDLWMRETHDKQTGGIPVGPDTSFLLAEVIASAIDRELLASLGKLNGTRYIDDYHLYFESLAAAERGLAELHRIAGRYELDINDLKTEIVELPEPLEPVWKSQLRSITLIPDDHTTSVKTLFDRAAELARQFPQDNVHTYAVKKLESALAHLNLVEGDWEMVDALLLRAAVGEPTSLPTILRILETFERRPAAIASALESICLHHAGLQQANEVAWALWTAKRLGVELSQETADAIELVDDDIVALVALDLCDSDLLPSPANEFSLWSEYMSAEHLYLDHWLLAYEALQQAWLPSKGGNDYVKADPYFMLLAKHSVRFYDTSADVPEPDSGYNDEDDDSYEEDEEGEEDEPTLSADDIMKFLNDPARDIPGPK
jgi:Reverse transcriptase (RNA-dependent DNA polymerase)